MNKQKNKFYFFRQAFCILFIMFLFINLSACQNKDEKELEIPENPDYYDVQSYDIGDIFTGSVWRMKCIDEALYFAGKAGDNIIIAAFDEKGQYLNEIVLAATEKITFVEDFCLKEDGSIACVCTVWDFENSSSIAVNTTNSYWYICFDPTGKELSKSALELPTSKYVSDFLIKDTNIYLLTDQDLFLFDETGSFIEQYETGGDIALNFVLDSKEMIHISCMTSLQNITLKKIDNTTNKIEKEYTTGLSCQQRFSWIAPKSNKEHYDFLMASANGIYGLYQEGRAVQLLTWTDCDIFIPQGASLDLVYLKEETYAVLDDNGIGKFFYIISKQGSKKKPKTELTLYGLNSPTRLPDNINLAVINWNKQHTDCRIHLIYDEYTDPATTLYFDILSGEGPDILFTYDHDSLQDLMKKNYFVDYYELMQQNPEGLQKEELLTNILQIFETEEGHLYSLPISISGFSLLAGKKTDLPAEKRWTLQELNALMEKQPIGTKVIKNDSGYLMGFKFYLGKEGLFDMLLRGSFQDYYNTTKGLNVEAFRELIAFIDRWYIETGDIQQEEDTSFLWACDIDSFTSIKYALAELNENFGKNGYDFTGYPCEQGTGVGIQEGLSFSIAANGNDVKAAWDFVQSFCSQEAQSHEYGSPVEPPTLGHDEFPVRKEVFEKIFEERRKQILPDVPISKKAVRNLQDFIKKADRLQNNPLRNCNDIYHIILEEMRAYYNGDKGQEEMLKILESRVNLYTNEKN